jgi:hypothetical protein
VELHAGRFVHRVPVKYDALLAAQAANPVGLGFDAARARTWWMFGDRFYWEAEGYTADEVKALVVAADLRRERRLEQAIALTAQAGMATDAARPPIPEGARIEVWRRDGGQCVRCGSRRNLEYDHIIPLAMGGSNTARNLQLLCEACNREKGASLT